MRSKEANEALKKLTQYTFVGSEVTQCEVCECIDIAINYIKELEKQIPTPSNEVPIENQTVVFVDKRDAVMKSEIRDKIKELEEEGQKHLFENGWFPMTAYTKIKVLKELLEGE